MASSTMAELLAQAEEAGVSYWQPEDKEHYEGAVVNANGAKTKNGDPKFGVQIKVDTGPDAGKSFWTNYNLRATTTDGRPNSQGLAYTFKDLAVLGADSSVVASWDVDSPSISEQVAAAVVGTRIGFDVSISGDFVNLKKLKRLGDAPAAQPAAQSQPELPLAIAEQNATAPTF